MVQREEVMKILFVNSGRPRAFVSIQSSIIDTLITKFKCKVRSISPQQFMTGNIEDAFLPDIILVFYGIFVQPKKILDVMRKGFKTVLWATEDPYQFDIYYDKTRMAYDYVFTNDLATIPYYNRENIYYLPACTDEKIYKPQQVNLKYKSDICIIGQGFPRRIRILNSLEPLLLKYKAKIIGQWDIWNEKLSPALKKLVTNYITDPCEVARYYNGAKININIHREWEDQSIPYNQNSRNIKAASLNSRTFDISACAAFQIVDNSREEVSDFFKPDKQIVTFDIDNCSDLVNKILFYLHNKKLRDEIRHNAYKQTVQNYTYRNIIRYMLDIINR
jgi:spore maturation protein CgeB